MRERQNIKSRRCRHAVLVTIWTDAVAKPDNCQIVIIIARTYARHVVWERQSIQRRERNSTTKSVTILTRLCLTLQMNR